MVSYTIRSGAFGKRNVIENVFRHSLIEASKTTTVAMILIGSADQSRWPERDAPQGLIASTTSITLRNACSSKLNPLP